MTMRALIADDHELFRSGLRQLLVDLLGATEVREAETLDQAIEILTNEGAGDLVLVDLRMPGMSGAEALSALRDGFPEGALHVDNSGESIASAIRMMAADHDSYRQGAARLRERKLRRWMATRQSILDRMADTPPGAALVPQRDLS